MSIILPHELDGATPHRRGGHGRRCMKNHAMKSGTDFASSVLYDVASELLRTRSGEM